MSLPLRIYWPSPVSCSTSTATNALSSITNPKAAARGANIICLRVISLSIFLPDGRSRNFNLASRFLGRVRALGVTAKPVVIVASLFERREADCITILQRSWILTGIARNLPQDAYTG
jgi:hypothetical protein